MEETMFSPPYSEPEYDSGLTVGESYIVYGIAIVDSQLAYYLHLDEGTYYPLLKPASCFAEPEGAVPDLFCLSTFEAQGKLKVEFSSKLFSENPYFYSDLLEANNNDPIVAEWTKFRKAVDLYNEYIDFKE